MPQPSASASSRPVDQVSLLVSALALREEYREEYWRKHDPILDDRLLWRAQTLRHTVHLLPGQSILELGCGGLRFTQVLLQVSRNENPITAVTFQNLTADLFKETAKVELLQLADLPGPLKGRQFDCIVGMDLLDRANSSELLKAVHELLAPGGEMLFYESNPWNPVHKVRWLFSRWIGKRDPRNLINRSRLYELLSEVGFVRIYAVFNDFVFAPLTRSLIWFLRNLSILLENAPVVRTTAGSILIHAQKHPRQKEFRGVSLCEHESLRRGISVVVPSHNEEMNIGPLTQRILALYGDYIHEIIPVNDGSTDRTGQVIEELASKDDRIKPLHRVPPSGVGLALADGIAAASGRYVLTMDCDFQHLLPEFRELFDAAAGGSDVVIGSRFSRHSVLLNYPFLKIVANRAFHTIAVLLFGRRIRDVTNNLKLMRQEVAHELRLRQRGFAANAEVGLQPFLLGYEVKQVPISWINRTPGMGASSFRLAKVGGGYWRVLFGLWVRHAFGVGPYRELGRERSSERRTDLCKGISRST